MTDDTRTDLTEGWPDEPGNEELARFAARLRSSQPALPPEATARIERAMGRAMSAEQARGARRRSAYPASVLSAAAAGLLGVGVYLYFRAAPSGSEMARAPAPGQRGAPAAAVHDRYRVRFAPLPPPAPDRALLNLEDHRSLYAPSR